MCFRRAPAAAGADGVMDRDGARTLKVDPIRCDGRGLCAELLPELIAVDDWGYPMIRGGTVPAELLDLAARAVRMCPVLALRLEAAEVGRNLACRPSGRRRTTRAGSGRPR